MLLLETLRRQITDGGVTPLAVVEAFYVTKNPALRLLHGQEGTVMYQLSLQSSEKGFGDRIIVVAPRGAHTLAPATPTIARNLLLQYCDREFRGHLT